MSTTFQEFVAAMEDVARDVVRACRRGADAIAAMPWPGVLACCVVLALLVSILPLALFLFIVFMAVKLVVGAFAVDRRRAMREHYTEQYGKQ
jgi:membrane protein implicated in regulation of membrane protease activity